MKKLLLLTLNLMASAMAMNFSADPRFPEISCQSPQALFKNNATIYIGGKDKSKIHDPSFKKGPLESLCIKIAANKKDPKTLRDIRNFKGQRLLIEAEKSVYQGLPENAGLYNSLWLANPSQTVQIPRLFFTKFISGDLKSLSTKGLRPAHIVEFLNFAVKYKIPGLSVECFNEIPPKTVSKINTIVNIEELKIDDKQGNFSNNNFKYLYPSSTGDKDYHLGLKAQKNLKVLDLSVQYLFQIKDIFKDIFKDPGKIGKMKDLRSLTLACKENGKVQDLAKTLESISALPPSLKKIVLFLNFWRFSDYNLPHLVRSFSFSKFKQELNREPYETCRKALEKVFDPQKKLNQTIEVLKAAKQTHLEELQAWLSKDSKEGLEQALRPYAESFESVFQDPQTDGALFTSLVGLFSHPNSRYLKKFYEENPEKTTAFLTVFLDLRSKEKLIRDYEEKLNEYFPEGDFYTRGYDLYNGKQEELKIAIWNIGNNFKLIKKYFQDLWKITDKSVLDSLSTGLQSIETSNPSLEEIVLKGNISDGEKDVIESKLKKVKIK